MSYLLYMNYITYWDTLYWSEDTVACKVNLCILKNTNIHRVLFTCEDDLQHILIFNHHIKYISTTLRILSVDKFTFAGNKLVTLSIKRNSYYLLSCGKKSQIYSCVSRTYINIAKTYERKAWRYQRDEHRWYHCTTNNII